MTTKTTKGVLATAEKAFADLQPMWLVLRIHDAAGQTLTDEEETALRGLLTRLRTVMAEVDRALRERGSGVVAPLTGKRLKAAQAVADAISRRLRMEEAQHSVRIDDDEGTVSIEANPAG